MDLKWFVLVLHDAESSWIRMLPAKFRWCKRQHDDLRSSPLMPTYTSSFHNQLINSCTYDTCARQLFWLHEILAVCNVHQLCLLFFDFERFLLVYSTRMQKIQGGVQLWGSQVFSSTQKKGKFIGKELYVNLYVKRRVWMDCTRIAGSLNTSW